MRQRLSTLAGLIVVLAAVALSAGPAAERRSDLPDRLTDQEFWKLTEDLSEPNGYFRSDNLVSNEQVFARVVPELVSRTKPGGVYLGVGPEQNFTYIAAMKPKMAFIIDIRRANLHLHLMYKALFELSADRAEFLGRLFTRTRPEGLTPQSTARAGPAAGTRRIATRAPGMPNRSHGGGVLILVMSVPPLLAGQH